MSNKYKFWNIAKETDDEVEIDFYGEVVTNKPWWVKEDSKVSFICGAEFLKDFEKLKNKKKVTAHINSTGGELYTGIAIANKIKTLSGETVAIIDGIAASAATLIASGFDKIKMYKGSSYMIHEASLYSNGFFTIQDLKELEKSLESANRSACELYHEKTGIEESSIRSLMKKETWMTSSEALEKGFIDEIIEKETKDKVELNGNYLIYNGVRMDCSHIHLPRSITAQAVHVDSEDISASKVTTEKGDEIMTLEELKQKYPELVAQIEKATIENATESIVNAERSRLQAIDEIADRIADNDLINNAKYVNPSTAEKLAIEALKNAKPINETNNQGFINSMLRDNANSGVDMVAPQGAPEEKPMMDESAKMTNLLIEAFKKGGNE